MPPLLLNQIDRQLSQLRQRMAESMAQFLLDGMPIYQRLERQLNIAL